MNDAHCSLYCTQDVFFLLRSKAKATGSDASRWSGQVAFPGGHAENGETDAECVARECMEEVGLDLNQHFEMLGEVKQRAVTTSYKGSESTLVVSCRVYHQLVAKQEIIQESEVAAAGWAPLTALTSDNFLQPIVWSTEDADEGGEWDGYPAVHLPMVRDEHLVLASGVTEENAVAKFNLWVSRVG